MFRRSPAKYSASPWYLLLGVILLAFLVKACAEPQPTQPPSESGDVQLAVGGSPKCQPTDAHGCVTVQVDIKGGGELPSDLVVTLVNGTDGPFDMDNPLDDPESPWDGQPKPLMLPVMNGVAKFEPPDFTLPPGGFCATVRQGTVEVLTAGGTFIVPTELFAPVSEAVAVGPRVSESANKDAPLTKEAYEEFCLWEYSDTDPPFEVAPGTAVSVRLTLGDATAIEVSCHFLQGSETAGTGETYDCPTWALADLTVYDGEDIDADETLAKIPWLDDVEVPGEEGNTAYDLLTAGVRVGVLVVASFGDASTLYASPGALLQIEAALAHLTASLTGKTAPGKGKKGGGGAESVDADLDPLSCVLNTDPPEPEGDAGGYLDFLEFTYGYDGLLALDQATFVADPERASIWYNYLPGSDPDLQSVNAHFRLKRNDPGLVLEGYDFTPDAGPETINLVENVDFSGCPHGSPVPSTFGVDLGGGVSVAVEVSCRVPIDEAAAARGEIRATWVLEYPASRVVEFRFQVNGEATGLDNYPSPERSEPGIIRSMIQIPYPLGEGGAIGGYGDAADCPLLESTIGKSNDPKWWPS